MSFVTQIGIFLIVWWLVLFATLPLWLQSSEEEEVEPGNDPGAPTNPNLGRKFLLTTGIAFGVSAVIIIAIEMGLFDSLVQNK